MVIGIYKIMNRINGKMYIGQSQNIQVRFNEHKRNLRKNVHANSHLQSAWNKYGEDSFDFEIIEECPVEQLDEKEVKYISELKTFENGYNLVEGGKGIRGWKHSDEFKERMRQSNLENPRIPSQEQIERLIEYNKTRNYHHSEETKEKMRQSHLGLKATEETKKNCSRAQKKVWDGNEERRKKHSDFLKEHNPNSYMSEESRKLRSQKISQANLGKKRSLETRKNIGNLHRGTKYMTNGRENKRVREEEFQHYLDQGYTFGRTKYWNKNKEITDEFS